MEDYNKSRGEAWREELRKSHTPKERNTIERVVMPQLDAKYRITCNEEVNQGITLEQARREATRCLDCLNFLLSRTTSARVSLSVLSLQCI